MTQTELTYIFAVRDPDAPGGFTTTVIVGKKETLEFMVANDVAALAAYPQGDVDAHGIEVLRAEVLRVAAEADATCLEPGTDGTGAAG